MKILVCIKQVCDGETPFTLSGDGKRIVLPERALYRMNRYDEFALEEAMRMKDQKIAEHIDAISVGTDRVATTLRKALEMGVNEAIHIRREDAILFPLTIATLIADYARGKGYDLILTGVMSEDCMNAAVGPMVASLLDMPCVTAVLNISIDESGKTLSVEREIDAGTRELYKVLPPAVLSVQSGINRPRYPALSNVLRAREKSILTVDGGNPVCPMDDLTMVSLHMPRLDRTTTLIQGTTREKAEGLYRWLHQRSLL